MHTCSFVSLLPRRAALAGVVLATTAAVSAVAPHDTAQTDKNVTAATYRVESAVQQAAVMPVISADVELVAQGRASSPVRAMELALGKLGAPYRYGSAGPGSFDCSGLVNWAYKQLGINVPRTSRALSGAGSPVSRGNLQPGDLVFFYRPVSHVGIYIGGGKFVHASNKKNPVKISSLADYGRNYAGARRIG